MKVEITPDDISLLSYVAGYLMGVSMKDDDSQARKISDSVLKFRDRLMKEMGMDQ